MKIPTQALPAYIHLLTRWTVAEKENMVVALAKADDKAQYKLKEKIAWEIIASIDGENEANNAQKDLSSSSV